MELFILKDQSPPPQLINVLLLQPPLTSMPTHLPASPGGSHWHQQQHLPCWCSLLSLLVSSRACSSGVFNTFSVSQLSRQQHDSVSVDIVHSIESQIVFSQLLSPGKPKYKEGGRHHHHQSQSDHSPPPPSSHGYQVGPVLSFLFCLLNLFFSWRGG